MKCLPERLALRALHVILAALLTSTVHVALSQSGEFPDNGTNLTVLCPANESCSQLNPVCLSCDYNESCIYGNVTQVTCQPLDTVNCTDEQSFTREFICRFCYQLPSDEYCCEPSTECNVRGTPSSLYTSNCSALNSSFCLGPRQFQKRLRCNHSSGRRWTTAFLLSITVGGFGVDRFYLGHWGSAVGKLLSFGGIGVWSILDVILVGAGFVGPADGSAYIY